MQIYGFSPKGILCELLFLDFVLEMHRVLELHQMTD